MLLRRIVSIRHATLRGFILGGPLRRPGRALRQFPLVAEQVFEVIVIPLHRVGGPCALQSAGDRVAAAAATKAVPPAEALLLETGPFGLGADVLVGVGGAVGFTESVSPSNERNGLFVIHRHASERLPDVHGCGEWIRGAVRPFRIYINKAHLYGAKRILEIPLAAVTLVTEPRVLRPPVNILFGLPDILAPAGETKRL